MGARYHVCNQDQLPALGRSDALGGTGQETPAIIEQDRLAKHKFENGSGKVPGPYGEQSAE